MKEVIKQAGLHHSGSRLGRGLNSLSANVWHKKYNVIARSRYLSGCEAILYWLYSKLNNTRLLHAQSGIRNDELNIFQQIFIPFRRQKIAVACSLLLLFTASCNKEKTTVSSPTTSGVYITNEGDFNSGKAEVSFYDPATKQVSNNLFYAVNNYYLGDVAQSMYIKDSVGFIVVNNSAKVEVVKIPSLQHLLTIHIANSSPRYFLPVNDSVAYVTDLYASAVHVVNYKTGSLISNITGVAEWTEHILLVNGMVVVEERNLASTPAHTGSIVTINPQTNTILQRYNFAGSNTDGLVTDNLNRVWMGMDADSSQNAPAALYCLNTGFAVSKKISLAAGHVVSNLKINGSGNEIYYFDNTGVAAISINDTTAPATPFIALNNRNFYGLGVEPVSGDVYVSDALDYVQKSVVYRYDTHGNLIQSFTAGVISGNFAFSNE